MLIDLDGLNESQRKDVLGQIEIMKQYNEKDDVIIELVEAYKKHIKDKDNAKSTTA